MSVGEEEDGGGKDDAQVSGLSNRVDWMVVSFTERETIDFLVEKWRRSTVQFGIYFVWDGGKTSR